MRSDQLVEKIIPVDLHDSPGSSYEIKNGVWSCPKHRKHVTKNNSKVQEDKKLRKSMCWYFYIILLKDMQQNANQCRKEKTTIQKM